MTYHTPSGDWQTMDYTCMNSFIKSVQAIDDDKLWVCGTFGAFPRVRLCSILILILLILIKLLLNWLMYHYELIYEIFSQL